MRKYLADEYGIDPKDIKVHTGNGANTTDKIYTFQIDGGKPHFVEVKGNNPTLGKAKVNGQYFEQGTHEYLKGTLEKMVRSPKYADKVDQIEELLKKVNANDYEYLLSFQKINTALENGAKVSDIGELVIDRFIK